MILPEQPSSCDDVYLGAFLKQTLHISLFLLFQRSEWKSETRLIYVLFGRSAYQAQ